MSLCCNPFGTTTYNKTLYSVDCNNTVSTLGECAMDKFYNKTDYHGDYASILCYNNKTDGKYQDLINKKGRNNDSWDQKALKCIFFIIVKLI